MAKFNYKSKCAHPRKCVKLMREFISDASDLIDEVEIGDDVLEIQRAVSLKKGHDGFRAYIGAEDIKIEYDFKSMNDIGAKEFYRNMIMRDPSLLGFSLLTLSLLHELGHHETEEDVPFGYDREKARNKMYKWGGKNERMINMMYFSLPDEWLATQWTIDWLSDEENRKRAKNFERDFFKAWRGK